MTVQHIVLVPIANPDTAAALLTLGLAFVRDENSAIIALYVVSGDIDGQDKVLEELEAIVKSLETEARPIDLQTRKATSIARGILDAAQEAGADLIVLGVKQQKRGRVVIGTIAENVVAIAPCNVLIHNTPTRSAPPKRVVAAVDGSAPARTASFTAWEIAQHYDAQLVAIYAQESHQPRWAGLGRIAESLEALPSDAVVRRELLNTNNPAGAILDHLDPDDLLVIGYAPGKSSFERWLMGNFSRRMLDQAPCPVLLTITTGEGKLLPKAVRREVNRFYLQLTPAEQNDIQRQGYTLSSSNLDYLVLIAIASALASLGLVANSPAVIIGAMLVAPFMQPCIAFGIGLASGRWRVMRRSLVAMLIGAPLAVLVAILSGVLAGISDPTPEMLARAQVTTLDVLIALASGVMGAYATVRKDIPAALAGVAVAAALMPPLCTFGLGIATGLWAVAIPAGLLFVTNIVCIMIASWIVFRLVGVRATNREVAA